MTHRTFLRTTSGAIRLLLLAAALAALSGFRAPPEPPAGGLDTRAPDAVLTDLDGNARAITQVAAGWVLLKFGTTWCPQCGDEVGELNRLAPFLRQRGVTVLEVFLREDPDVVRRYLDRTPRRYPETVLLDSRGKTIPRYGIRVIPRLVLVDPDGIIRFDSRYLDADELRDGLARAMDRR